MGTILKFPIKGTPMWNYIRHYYMRLKISNEEAANYLMRDVPYQLRNQVRATLAEIKKEANAKTKK